MAPSPCSSTTGFGWASLGAQAGSFTRPAGAADAGDPPIASVVAASTAAIASRARLLPRMRSSSPTTSIDTVRYRVPLSIGIARRMSRWGVPDSTRPRPPRSETRRRVLDAAFAVFGERGIAGSSLTEVARAAGLTKGAVYSSFASKDDLVLALMEEHAAQRMSSAIAQFDGTDDVDAALVQVAGVLVRAMRTDAAWHRLLAEYFALTHRAPERRAALRERRREARNAVARALERVVAETGLRLPLPVDDLVVVLFALSNGLAVESAIDPDVAADDLLARVLLLLAGTGR